MVGGDLIAEQLLPLPTLPPTALAVDGSDGRGSATHSAPPDACNVSRRSGRGVFLRRALLALELLRRLLLLLRLRLRLRLRLLLRLLLLPPPSPLPLRVERVEDALPALGLLRRRLRRELQAGWRQLHVLVPKARPQPCNTPDLIESRHGLGTPRAVEKWCNSQR